MTDWQLLAIADSAQEGVSLSYEIALLGDQYI